MTVVAILISNKVNFEAKSIDWNISTLNLYASNNMESKEIKQELRGLQRHEKYTIILRNFNTTVKQEKNR